MSRFHVAFEAQRDLDDIWLYIATDNPSAADEWLATVEESFRLIGDEPFVGQGREDLLPGLRFLPVGNYLIFYFPLTDRVEIVRVIHGARDYGPEYF
jgi:toxin ParE1/3/4